MAAVFDILLIFSCCAPPFGTHINKNKDPSAWIQGLRSHSRADRIERGKREGQRDRTARKNEDETKTKEETVAAKEAFLFGNVCWQEAIRCLFRSKPVAQ